MKKMFLILCLCGAVVARTHAQQHNENLSIKQIAQGNNAGLNALTDDDLWGVVASFPFLADLQQAAIDANQVAKINVVGNLNTAVLTQFGFNNVGIINIIGNENDAALTQEGSDLLSILNIQGNLNELSVTQDGETLQNYIEVNGDGISFNVLQNNMGLIYSQDGAVPITIERTGRIVPIIITNN